MLTWNQQGLRAALAVWLVISKHVLAPVLSYLGKTHITALEYPITLSIIVDLRHTRESPHR